MALAGLFIRDEKYNRVEGSSRGSMMSSRIRSGIGLSIVTHIVDVHGGRVIVPVATFRYPQVASTVPSGIPTLDAVENHPSFSRKETRVVKAVYPQCNGRQDAGAPVK
jgi:hypothetical protein